MPRLSPYGFARTVLNIAIPGVGFLVSTSQVSAILSKTLGFACVLEKMEVVTTAVGTGAGASRVLNVRKGSATGTVVATATLALATQGTLGTVNVGTLTTANAANKFSDTDTLTVEFASGGTTFTAGGVELVLTFRHQLAKEA
ncbi:MAG: hypothetical protein HY829_00835 [Actinobacteria bacterium]|nr:hypothetical protein [Actinomycetota bacterium]